MESQPRRDAALVIAALLIGLGSAGLAHADSSVTLYGIADAGYGYRLYDYGSGAAALSKRTSGMRDGVLDDNRWGLRGAEALGSGLKATFQFEQGFNLTDGSQASSTSAFNRIATVGLSSQSWGDFSLGLQRGVSQYLFTHFNTYEGLGKMERAFGAYKVRRNGMVRYLSRDLAGIKFGLAYAPNGTAAGAGASQRTNYIGSGLSYSSGPWLLAATYDQEQPLDGSGRHLGYTVKSWALGGSYDFTVFKLNFAWGQDRNGKMNKPGAVDGSTLGASVPGIGAYNSPGFRSNNYFVSAIVPLGVQQVALTWSRTQSNLASVYAADNGGTALVTSTQNIVSAVYRYSLSKRTILYAYGAYADGLAYLSGFRGRELGLGLFHRF